MADATNWNVHGLVDKRMPVARERTNPQAGAFATNTKNVQAMRARLFAISPSKYSGARMDSMTVNDMIYALTLEDEAASI